MADQVSDPFLERMPPTQRFYLQAQQILEDQMGQAIQRFAQERPSEPLLTEQSRHFVDYEPKFTDGSLLGGDSFICVRLGSEVIDNDNHRGESYLDCLVALYQDGSPYIDDADMDFAESLGGKVVSDAAEVPRYAIYAAPELPPFAVLASISDWGIDKVQAANQASGEKGQIPGALMIKGVLEEAGYHPHVLSDQDCTNLLEGLNNSPLNFHEIFSAYKGQSY